jgi:hypothetical protein
MNAPTPILMDVDQPAALPFPQSLPEFQRLFPDDAACAEYLDPGRDCLKERCGNECAHADSSGRQPAALPFPQSLPDPSDNAACFTLPVRGG